MTDISDNKRELSLEDGIPTFSTSTIEEDASLKSFDEPEEQSIPPSSKAKQLHHRLSSVSKMYDVDGDGVLDEYEQALRDMDKSGRGFMSNSKALDLLKTQMELQKKMLTFKRVIIALSVFTLILALANLGTAWAAATLAKDTSVESGALVDKNTHEVIATGDNVLVVEGTTSLNEDSRKLLNGRGLESSQTFTATVSLIAKTFAQALSTHCPDPAYVDRVFPLGGRHNLYVCPSSSSGSTTSMSMGGITTTTYAYEMTNAKQLVISCLSNQEDCTMSGDALLLPANMECITPSDCESNSCSFKLDGTPTCDVCNATTNTMCVSPRQCYSMEDIAEAQRLSDAPPACLIPVGGDCSQDEFGCLTRECHEGICRCSTFSGFGCADGETCLFNETLGYAECL